MTDWRAGFDRPWPDDRTINRGIIGEEGKERGMDRPLTALIAIQTSFPFGDFNLFDTGNRHTESGNGGDHGHEGGNKDAFNGGSNSARAIPALEGTSKLFMQRSLLPKILSCGDFNGGEQLPDNRPTRRINLHELNRR